MQLARSLHRTDVFVWIDMDDCRLLLLLLCDAVDGRVVGGRTRKGCSRTVVGANIYTEGAANTLYRSTATSQALDLVSRQSSAMWSKNRND